MTADFQGQQTILLSSKEEAYLNTEVNIVYDKPDRGW